MGLCMGTQNDRDALADHHESVPRSRSATPSTIAADTPKPHVMQYNDRLSTAKTKIDELNNMGKHPSSTASSKSSPDSNHEVALDVELMPPIGRLQQIPSQSGSGTMTILEHSPISKQHSIANQSSKITLGKIKDGDEHTVTEGGAVDSMNDVDFDHIHFQYSDDALHHRIPHTSSTMEIIGSRSISRDLDDHSHHIHHIHSHGHKSDEDTTHEYDSDRSRHTNDGHDTVEEHDNSMDDDDETEESDHFKDINDGDDDDGDDGDEEEEEEPSEPFPKSPTDKPQSGNVGNVKYQDLLSPHTPCSPSTPQDDHKMSLNDYAQSTFRCIQSVTATEAGTSNGKKKTNQDSCFCFNSFGPSSFFQLYGVCDGHGPSGHNVSQFVRDKLPQFINQLLTNSLCQYSMTTILKKAFEATDEALRSAHCSDTLHFDINYSGTTVTMGLVAGDKLYVANLGDSRTVLAQIPGTTHKTVPVSVPLSHDHDPENSTEMVRIQQSESGKIIDSRIQIELPEIAQNNAMLTIDALMSFPTESADIPPLNGQPSLKGNKSNSLQTPKRHQRTQSLVKKISASVSRSLGDVIAHEYGGLISEPEVIVHSLCDDDIFVIFASDGIWQMIENDDVMRVIGTKLNASKEDAVYDDLQKTTNKLVREANISWQDEYEDYTDDITCVIARIGKIHNDFAE